MENSADVLIVTVTDVESRAVLTAFARATGQKSRAVTISDRIYRDLGTLRGTRAFLALSEMGAGGMGASQQTVQKGIAALRPTAVVMVGVAFGMNEQKQALGDILVSRQLMLYDLQRVGASQITPRGDRPHGSARLLNYFTSAALDWSGAKVRFGLLLTGDKLVDNIDYRGQLQRLESEAIGGEMEGAGLYVACQDAKVDWVLVKAICDWADGSMAQDKDARQQEAADNAAAFVVHTLLHAAFNRAGPPDLEDAAKLLVIAAEPTRSRALRLAIILASLALFAAAALIGYYRWFAQHDPAPAGRTDMSLHAEDEGGPPTASSPNNPLEMILIHMQPFQMSGSENHPIRPQAHAENFWIDRTEVSVADFSRCTECFAKTGGLCNHKAMGRENHPINCVDYFQASLYCRKLGKRLPTEAEWENAASWVGMSHSSPNETESQERVCWGRKNGTCAIGTTPSGKRGLADMVGNVWEWTLNPECAAASKQCPESAEGSTRGGSWASTGQDFLRPSSSHMYPLSTQSPYVGFRCAKDAIQ